MSHNFELLTQTGYELGLRENGDAADTTRTPAKAVGPGASSDGEMFRLVQRVFLSTDGSARRQVVFCGVDGKNGSSSVCVGTGRILAAHDSRSVCLVEANLKSPHLSDMFGLHPPISFFGKSTSLREHCVQITGNLWLAGPGMLAEDRGALPSADGLKHRLAQLRLEFEYVLIDAPGANVSGDTAQLGQLADAVILVIEANSTRRIASRRAKEALEAAGVSILGTVLRDRLFPIPEVLYRKL
jgi:protein-tyrosine kinase